MFFKLQFITVAFVRAGSSLFSFLFLSSASNQNPAAESQAEGILFPTLRQAGNRCLQCDFKISPLKNWNCLLLETAGQFVNLLDQFKTMTQSLSINDLKKAYPNEWVLIGNPVMDDKKLNVLSGIPLYHSEDKKEVCYIGRDKTSGYEKITLIYTGTFKPIRKITGIFNRVKK